MRPRSSPLALVLLAIEACGAPAPATPAGTTGTTGPIDACGASDECSEAFCVAPWDTEQVARGPAACSLDCVADDDLSRFCIDDAACCGGSRCNEADGLCAAIDPGTSSGSSSESSSGSSSGSGSESSSGFATGGSSSGSTGDGSTG